MTYYIDNRTNGFKNAVTKDCYAMAVMLANLDACISEFVSEGDDETVIIYGFKEVE